MGSKSGIYAFSRQIIASRLKVNCGVDSMEGSRVETVPGPEPRTGPTPTTGSSDPSALAREGRNKETGKLNIMHWNAEGVRNKKLDLQQFLKTHSIDRCCIQETHLKDGDRFTIRGYEPFRADREEGTKGGALTLVKNTIPAVELYKSTTDNTEIIGIIALL